MSSGNLEPRQELLINMYNQMYNDINRHILVVWQCIGVVIGAFAIFALVEKNIVSVDIATSLIILLAGWMIGHLYDAGYWYNRNLVIIANIERQFLLRDDLKNIHYYFGKHRQDNKMITHLRIQMFLGIGLSLIVFLFHFLTRVVPGFHLPLSDFDPPRTMPYIVAIATFIWLTRLKRDRDKSYKEFILNSPGAPVDVEGIEYGIGHGHPVSRASSSS